MRCERLVSVCSLPTGWRRVYWWDPAVPDEQLRTCPITDMAAAEPIAALAHLKVADPEDLADDEWEDEIAPVVIEDNAFRAQLDGNALGLLAPGDEMDLEVWRAEIISLVSLQRARHRRAREIREQAAADVEEGGASRYDTSGLSSAEKLIYDHAFNDALKRANA